MSETPKQHLEATEVAPHGWDLVGSKSVVVDPSVPTLSLGGSYWAPAKPKPRAWTGTVNELSHPTLSNVWGWGDEVQVTVTEVLE